MRITLTDREYQEIREKVQLIETIIDGATQQKEIDRRRLKKALSAVRSIQSRYFPQANYSLHYFRHGGWKNRAGEQPLHRKNYWKYRREKLLESHPKIRDYVEPMEEAVEEPCCGNCRGLWVDEACLGTVDGSPCEKWEPFNKTEEAEE